MHKRFQKRVEDFVCLQCGKPVSGSGFTNHCPHCLYSQHVDIHPGDRNASCKGLMEPIGVTEKAGEWVILQKCVRCGHERKQHTATNDDFDAILALAKKTALESMGG
jgi:DNA-directed RNA polymerase subunit RPC12/RpoP